MATSHNRTPPAAHVPPEPASLRVDFEWCFVGKVTLLSESPFRLRLPDVRHPGVYRLSAAVRGGSIDDQIWYVGQSMKTIDSRIRRHLREEFDAQTSKGKKFLERLRHADGWCQLEEARNIRLDGSPELAGLKGGSFDRDAIAALPSEWRSAAQFVMNVVEAAGQVTSETMPNRQGKR